MDKQKIIAAILKIVKKELGNESSGHDFFHCQRVVELALKIGQKEKADLWVLQLAGWLHDLGAAQGRKNHELRSAKKAQKILADFGIEQKTIDKVVECVKNHRYSTGKAVTLEDKVLRDADKLDVMGAIGIGRLFACCGKFKRIKFFNGKLNPDPARYKRTGWSPHILDHIYEKVFLLPDLLNTQTAKKIGQQRIKFVHQFVEQFLKEWSGEDY
jgi:uncharacterized protein